MNIDYTEAYRLLYLVRHTEEEIGRRYHIDDPMRCPTHLSIGQETSAVGLAMALRPGDQVYSYHRCHAHYLAKGGNLTAMLAELYGKATGCSGGWGGSMHLVDAQASFTEASTSVGNSVSLAVGAALAFKLDGSGRVAVACCGDSTVETGQFWEAANFAALHQLPMMFFCENNTYSTSTPINQRQPASPVFRRVQGFMWSRQVEDREIDDVWQAAKECREAGPGFLEVGTYRFREHVGPNYDWDVGYRTESEVREHMAHDPIMAVRAKMKEEDVAAIEDQIQRQVLKAFEEAEAAPWPEEIIV
jgi:pyruvate dehydrogenase E1 component alpha subunit